MTHDGRQPIDLRRLPAPARYAIALAVVIPVALLAWHVGKDQPPPEFLTKDIIPFLAWCYIAIGAAWLIRKVHRAFHGGKH